MIVTSDWQNVTEEYGGKVKGFSGNEFYPPSYIRFGQFATADYSVSSTNFTGNINLFTFQTYTYTDTEVANLFMQWTSKYFIQTLDSNICLTIASSPHNHSRYDLCFAVYVCIIFFYAQVLTLLLLIHLL